MRTTIIATLLLTGSFLSQAQRNDIGWIAPEGKIINHRTLTWNDFQETEDKEHAKSLSARNLQAEAYVSPAIYFEYEDGEKMANGRVKFKFKVKCAFQSIAFARESTKKEHSNYVLIHEQDHYDVALNFANRLQYELESRDYSEKNYNEEIEKLTDDIYKRYRKVQETYDGEVNPDGRDVKEMQYLWDMRIKKCLENNTEEFYFSPEAVVKSVKSPGQTVKRIPEEKTRQFVVRARPLYTEMSEEMGRKIIETNEWSAETSIIAFFTQKFYINIDGALPKDNYRTFAYVFVPNGKDTYKRILIDTFCNGDYPTKIASAFFTNADNDPEKELVIIATSNQKDNHANGTLYMNRVYDNLPRLLPGKIKRLEEQSARISGGFDGTVDGKTLVAKYKTEKEITDALKLPGQSGAGAPAQESKKTIRQ